MLTFPAGAEHDGETVVCAAKNEVMEEALKEETVLDVLCKFCVFVKQDDMFVFRFSKSCY